MIENLKGKVISNFYCVQAKGEHILILHWRPLYMLGVRHTIQVKLIKIFYVEANLAAPEDILRGYDLAFVIPTLLIVPTHMEICLSCHQEIRLCKFFIFKFEGFCGKRA